MRKIYLVIWSFLILFSGAIYAETAEVAGQKSAPAEEKTSEPKAAEETTPVERGKALHAEKCVSCHASDVYTREERKVTRYESLQSQVQTCAVNLDLSWFDDEINDVVTYLNTNYYQFKTETDAKSTDDTVEKAAE